MPLAPDRAHAKATVHTRSQEIQAYLSNANPIDVLPNSTKQFVSSAKEFTRRILSTWRQHNATST